MGIRRRGGGRDYDKGVKTDVPCIRARTSKRAEQIGAREEKDTQ